MATAAKLEPQPQGLAAQLKQLCARHTLTTVTLSYCPGQYGGFYAYAHASGNLVGGTDYKATPHAALTAAIVELNAQRDAPVAVPELGAL